MELQNKLALVTGAAGFIGSHLSEELVKMGVKVRAFVRYKSDGSIGNLEKLPKEILDQIEIVRGDIKNPDSVDRATNGVDVVFHLASLISIPYSYVDPRDFVETNVGGIINVLTSAKRYNAKKIVITSTSESYGTALYTPIDEKHPCQPQSPYSATKISADKIAESFYKSYGLPVTIIRPFNTYGPRQSKRAIIPTIIYQALTKPSLKLGSLTPKRDLVYVKDTVKGFIKIAESDESIGESVNICTGSTITIGDLVKMIGSILGKELDVKTDEEKIRPKNSEVNVLLGDCSKAKTLLKWESEISLEDGLKNVIEHIKNNLNDYKLERENI
jgi:NAD dependent epimerase/dehydratase